MGGGGHGPPASAAYAHTTTAFIVLSYCTYVSMCVCREYRPIPRLDTYEDADLDHEEYEALSPGARAEVERRLRKRDRQEALASGRTRPGLLYDASEDDEISAPLARRRRPAGEDTQEGMEFEEVSTVTCMYMYCRYRGLQIRQKTCANTWRSTSGGTNLDGSGFSQDYFTHTHHTPTYDKTHRVQR